MLKVALTHDVDRLRKTYQYLTYSLKSLRKGNFSEMVYHLTPQIKTEPYWNLYNIAELEKSYGVRSTFFILDESIKFNPLKPKTFALAVGRYNMFEPKIQEAIRYLDGNGWEIGLHGSYLSYNNKELLLSEKKRIESIVGHAIIGTRQHHLNLDKSTWKIQEEIGLKYDSTWGYNRDIGFKEDKIQPFYPNNSKFVEFPMTVMDVSFMPMDENKRWNKFLKLLDVTEQHNAVMVINFHNRVYNEREYPGYKTSYCRMIEESLKRKAEIGPMINFFNQLQQ